MDKIIDDFLKLTDYTYIYGDEHELEKYLPKGLSQDELGNYYIEIGESETMFCSHLDTAAFQKQKVEHHIWRDKKGTLFVGTTGETYYQQYTNTSGETYYRLKSDATLLGADDKSGVVIMMHMIEKNVPGLYYFFVGEEVGRVGSTGALKRYRDNFQKYKKCVAFDRRGYGSIISKQMGRACCSNEFVDELANELKKNGMEFRNDPTGIYTDSATFMDVIPECTNLSVGYFNEHTESEYQNLSYLVKLANTLSKVNWESLPVKRNPNPFKTADPVRKPKKLGDLSDDELWDIYIDVDDALESIAYVYCMNYKDFIPEKEMIYIDYYTDNMTSVWIHEDGTITINKQKFYNFKDLKEALLSYFNHHDEFNNKKNKKSNNYIQEEEEEDEDYDYIEDTKSESEISKMANEFKKGLNIKQFVFDVVGFANSKNKSKLTPKEMYNILDDYDKDIEEFIFWLYSNNNDPDKTYGIVWDDDNDVFIIYSNIEDVV